ncbi:MAG: TonB-dependent receptor, partial [Halieaceae bacterium]|jgi:iron complex outermembrane receptor protein|nr:TonB-dependent receptor [Halieaceae bacterium]
MQREVNLPSETAGILQLVRNTASAALSGVEASAGWQVSDDLRLMADVALLDARYREVLFDLNGDGLVDGADRNLDLPRAPELTWGLSAEYLLPGSLPLSPRIRASYGYRDRVAYTDNNLGFILEQELLDLDLTLRSDDRRWTFSAYGRNLLDAVKHGGDSQLPAVFFGQPLGGTFAPLARGRLLGLELAYSFD